MNQQLLDLYADYLSVTFGYATATNLSSMLEGELSHDALTRFLSAREYTSKDLWKQVKRLVRELESKEGVLIFDDTIQEKLWMQENELVCWHYDHTKGRSVKGINLLNCLYYQDGVSVPVAFELVKKPIWYSDVKTRKTKRASKRTKNEMLREMFTVCLQNQLQFEWVLFDIWFGSAENMHYIKQEHGKDFITALKSNRQVALSEEDWKNGCFTRIDELDLPEQEAVTAWLKGVNFPLRLARQVFTNKDGSTGTLYLSCSKLEANWDTITTAYQKRWKVEVFHKSLKSNVAMAKSPARRVVAQANHVFASIVAAFKLESLRMKKKLNPFSLRSKLYISAIRTAFDELQKLRTA